MKTLKREEIYANDYLDIEHLRVNLEFFIGQYYNRHRFHSALGYRPLEEFERSMLSSKSSEDATMRFFKYLERLFLGAA